MERAGKLNTLRKSPGAGSGLNKLLCDMQMDKGHRSCLCTLLDKADWRDGLRRLGADDCCCIIN